MIKINLFSKKDEKATKDIGQPMQAKKSYANGDLCPEPKHVDTQSLFNSDWYIMGTAGDKGV